ncbi:MAG TPA: DUF4325 domain-containing protein [Bacteroidia bacterium]|jgi:hypothetical protein|nr:DUF4325 domain-containing protein [Bacteroidia bacterium]
MKPTKKILISDKTKNFLISREAGSSLFTELNSPDFEYELDFSNIEFISRSYADQFYKMKEDFEKKFNTRIHIINANEEVINMLHVVSKTQNLSERNFENVPIYRFSKIDNLSDYLLSI